MIFAGLLFYEALVLPLSEMAVWGLRNKRQRWEEQQEQKHTAKKEETPAVFGTSSTTQNIEKMDPNEEYRFRGGFLESGSWDIVADVDNDGNKETIRIVQEKIEGELTSYKVTANLLKDGKETPFVRNNGGPFSWAKIINLDNYGPKEFLFETIEGKLAHTLFYRYVNGRFSYVTIIPENGPPGFFGRNGAHLWDTGNNLLIYFPTEESSLLRGGCEGKGELYTYYNHTLVKLYNISIAPEWCKEFKG